MEQLRKGVQRFEEDVFPGMKEHFASLANQQSPKTLFITCSDSRIDPSLITQTQPGEIFVIRNAGNIVPPHSPEATGETATIEYAVAVLKVSQVVVCGHSGCGAMNALMNPESAASLPTVYKWLSSMESTKAVMNTNFSGIADPARKLDTCIEQNVLCQLDNLKTLPSVAARLKAGEVTLHGWVYDIPSGTIREYDEDQQSFQPLKASVGAS